MKTRLQRHGVPNKGIKADAKKQRRNEGDVRQATYDLLSTEEKIAKLDQKLGIDVGAVKQRKRLAGV